MKTLMLSLICAVLCTLCFLLTDGGALTYAAWALLAAAVLLAALSACSLIRRKPPVPTDPDPDGTRFTTQLTEMMDTISRATAERDCGISTQMLYEQARFCEPCTDSSLRETEHEILAAIAQMHPDDPDELITQKCSAVQRMLEKRRHMIK